ncbi:MAG: GNAT family N-acetyltransferase [Bacillota bacterium]
MIRSRSYKEGDYRRVMNFLREIYKINKNQHCWLPSRWEYAEYLVNPLYIERGYSSWEEFIRIWEAGGEIVAVAHKEDICNAFLQVRPGYRNLEEDMVNWVEDNIYEIIDAETGRERKTVIWVNESDSYRKNLLAEFGFEVVESEDGSWAASCIIWYDQELKIGMFEPVGTHPDYLRKGLGRAVILEGLRRLKALGSERAYVEAYGDKRYAFYKSAGFESFDIDYPFTKIK